MKSKNILLILVMGLFCFNFAQARRIQDVGINTTDEYGTTTEYIKIDNNWLPLKVIDSNGNLLEEYHYSKFTVFSGYPQRVIFRNIKTGGWIELTEIGGGYSISLDGEDVGIVDWYKIGSDIVKIGNLTIGKDGKKGRGIGLSVVNWIAKWVKQAEGIDKITYTTQNPLMLNILDEISEIYNETYNYCRELEHQGVPVNRRLEVLMDCSYFYIGKRGRASTFRATDYAVSIENGSIRQSNWQTLPEGTYAGRLNVLEDWTITLDGEEIGQVKRFDRQIAFLGVTNPIKIYINEEEQIIRY